MNENDLLSLMPGYYRNSKVISNLNNANSIELTKFKSKLESIMNQYFVDTADFTLERWEKELGLTVANNYNTDYRRSRIKSKLRGQGTVTVKLIENVAESFSNGEVEVIENNIEYTFTIKFVGSKGIPPNINDLKKSIEEIKPAHLKALYEFTYNTWDMVSKLTWGSANSKTWKQLRESDI